ncbi:hypothetical protein PUNSTDRAFT_131272 [Punctularia strigosozonata HHB-11173 SS5]|uniref:uncharacterized protein n=1 Tax=Punctularia strigosozonata (strain HHB-11173) TaxID=741275 RepID=UPI0004417762|nr:uncharacterized protein PUNSTDRAFT_131272 [Punctularia strigosozonata HHB-11173 SS5]EIN13050.1 hypothetical protein PUNSTDRAFT_131272 [Punctularia strigosozonata HHB-11173 SS5]
MAIGTTDAEQVFLFDALTLDASGHPAQRLFNLLRDPRKRKLVWDGRMDFIEIWSVYGIPLNGVLDLQIVEVVSRVLAGEDDNQRLGRMARMLGAKEVFRGKTRWKYDDIHRLCGMNECVKQCGFGSDYTKDEAVVRMHRNLGSAFWMDRPLSSQLLHYAAQDIKMISLIYEHFTTAGLLKDNMLPLLLDQCKRYVSLHQQSGRVEQGNSFRSNGFLPLDILKMPSQDRRVCSGCNRFISAKYFNVGDKCRVCQAVILKEMLARDKELEKTRKTTKNRDA